MAKRPVLVKGPVSAAPDDGVAGEGVDVADRAEAVGAGAPEALGAGAPEALGAGAPEALGAGAPEALGAGAPEHADRIAAMASDAIRPSQAVF
jgi:hypothetical protein